MTLACIYAFNERKYAKKQIEQMIKDVEFMQQAEDNLKSTQEKYAISALVGSCLNFITICTITSQKNCFVFKFSGKLFFVVT